LRSLGERVHEESEPRLIIRDFSARLGVQGVQDPPSPTLFNLDRRHSESCNVEAERKVVGDEPHASLSLMSPEQIWSCLNTASR
jgi:hypothetical protein